MTMRQDIHRDIIKARALKDPKTRSLADWRRVYDGAAWVRFDVQLDFDAFMQDNAGYQLLITGLRDGKVNRI